MLDDVLVAPARGDDDADGRRDRARSRRARLGGPADPHAARRAERRCPRREGRGGRRLPRERRPGRRGRCALAGLAALPYPRLLEVEVLGELLGFLRSVNPVDHVAPRGYRALAHITRLPSRSSSGSSRTWTASTRSCARASATSRRWQAWEPFGRARSGGAAAPAGAQPRRSVPQPLKTPARSDNRLKMGDFQGFPVYSRVRRPGIMQPALFHESGDLTKGEVGLFDVGDKVCTHTTGQARSSRRKARGSR